MPPINYIRWETVLRWESGDIPFVPICYGVLEKRKKPIFDRCNKKEEGIILGEKLVRRPCCSTGLGIL